MHKSLIILGYSLLICIVSNAQEFRKSPKHPKGNPGKQEKALVFYNEAVQAYIEQGYYLNKKIIAKSNQYKFGIDRGTIVYGRCFI